MWKAKLVTQSSVDSSGRAEYVYDFYRDDILYAPSINFICYPSERTRMVIDRLERLKSEYELSVEVDEGEEIIL